MATSFAIGCLVQWYEIEMFFEYVDTLIDAIDAYDQDNVLIDIKLLINQDLEKLDNSNRLIYILQRFEEQIDRLENYKVQSYVEKNLITIADYRRDFNNKYCEIAEVLIWGETDMLVPRQIFLTLNQLHQNVNTTKYLATFGICKMWDDSWKPLEHPDFTDKPFIEGDDKNWWSIPYTMSKNEMNSFNDKIEDLTIVNITPHKFNGCGLVISSEVIKSGVNIPISSFFIHEDTSFMLMTNKILGSIPQYHIKNILLVHNRKHPKKRMYVAGEEENSYIDDKRKINDWYNRANKLCQINNSNLFNPEFKSYTWDDVWNIPQ